MKSLNVLVACEESQAVTKEFRALGHEAYSCDILQESGGHPEWHIKDDVLPILKYSWDLVIAFPPCTHLAVSGAQWFPQKRADGRQQQGIDFFMAFTKLSCPFAIENPVGIMSSEWRKPDQIINPWQFGDPFEKKTCLWLHELPQLVPTDIVEPEPRKVFKSGKSHPGWYAEAFSLSKEDRARARSKTFPGIARAMATQWSKHLETL